MIFTIGGRGMNAWLIIWLIVAGVMIVAEIMSLGLTTIWFAGGAIVAGILGYFGVHWAVQLVAFAVVSIVLLVFTRPIVAKRMIKEPEKTNVDGMIGQKAVVKETIDNINAKGAVSVNGVEWTARSVDDTVVEEGSLVEVVEVKGVKLFVKNI